MNSRNILALLAVALLATSVFTIDTDYKCTHGEEEWIEPELNTDVEEDYNPDGNNHEGRSLADYPNFRAVGYYGFLRTSVSYFQNDLIPPILDYFSKALKVKYPQTGPLRVTSGSLCGKSIPSVLRNGIEADYVLMIETYSQSNTVVAATQICSYGKTGRPLVAYARVNSHNLQATSSVLVHEKNMICMMHEITHSLGFVSNMYNRFIDANGKKQSGLIINAKLAGITTKVLTAEPLRTMLRQHFGCPTLPGAYMENTGGSGTTAHHFDRKIFAFEYMTSGLIYEMQVSKFTLGLLQSTGWYVPDYSYADEFNWGKGQGCSFVTGTCSANSFSEYCSGSGRRCTNPGRSSGSCKSDSRSDGCKFVHPSISYDCDNSQARNNARLPSAEAYGRGSNSRCFDGSLSTGGSASNTAFCFKFTCTGSGYNTQLNVKIGSKTAICTQKGAISVSGYSGKIQCPDPQEFCAGAGAAICPRGCMGRGTCVNGVCQCKAGFKGTDCALRNAF